MDQFQQLIPNLKDGKLRVAPNRSVFGYCSRMKRRRCFLPGEEVHPGDFVQGGMDDKGNLIAEGALAFDGLAMEQLQEHAESFGFDRPIDIERGNLNPQGVPVDIVDPGRRPELADLGASPVTSHADHALEVADQMERRASYNETKPHSVEFRQPADDAPDTDADLDTE